MHAGRKITTVMVTLIWAVQATAQPIYFDAMFDAHLFTETLNNAVENDDGYVFAARSRNLTVDTAVMTLIQTDHLGDELWRAEYSPGAGTFTFGELSKHPQGGYVLFNSIGMQNEWPYKNFHMVRYTSGGAVEWVKDYGEGVRDDVSYYGVICGDGGMAMVGQSTDSTVTTADIMLVRTDSIGTEIWRELYGGGSWEGATGMVQWTCNKKVDSRLSYAAIFRVCN